MRRWFVAIVALAGVLAHHGPACAADGSDTLGRRINNLKVLSDKIDDVTTPEAILKSFVKPGMSDQDRARALWKAIVKYRHQTIPPHEYLAADSEAHDPVKIFNVYGYCMCCCTSALVAALNRLDGRDARGRILNGHSVPEVRYGDAWHMFDASLITYFPKANGGVAASVDEISASIAEWHAAHPGYRKRPAQIFQLMKSDGWTGWQTQGPDLLAKCPFYKSGYLPARTHGWDATMLEYDRKSEIYEYGYQVGHRAVFSLRAGESFVREAGNRGLHVNAETLPDWEMLKARAPLNDLVYVNDFFPGYRGGVVGNGVHTYAPALSAGDLAAGSDVYENLRSGGSPALRPIAAGRPGVAVIPMISPYVYLRGRVKLNTLLGSERDRVALSISTNNGRSFKPLWSAEKPGAAEAEVDLTSSIVRRYAYWLKLEIHSEQPEHAGLERLVVENDFQHAPRTLPWLGAGANAIVVSADGDPTVATRAVSCRIPEGNANDRKNDTTADYGIIIDNLRNEHGGYWWTRGTGTMTVPIEMPGDLAALRFCAQVRARGAKDLVRMLVSTDRGNQWREVGRIAGPTPGRTQVFRVADWPASTRKALLRFELTGNNTIGIMSFRADADYRDPLAAHAVPAFQVVHRWTERGRERSHAATIDRLPMTYTIDAGADPEMVSVTYEMPPSQ